MSFVKVKDIDFIVIHHSATEDNNYALNWEAIRRWHIHHNGWNDIGYHFGVEMVGNTLQILVGRPLGMVGAHTLTLNKRSIGVVMIGNFDKHPPSPEIYNTTLRFVKYIANFLSLPAERIIGHREVNVISQLEGRNYHYHGTCPGKLFSMEKFRRDLGLTVEDENLMRILNKYDNNFTRENRG